MGTMESMATAVYEARSYDRAPDTCVPIDHAYLARFTLGNTSLEHEVLELFADHAPTYLLRLMAATTDRAWYEAAHTLKGSARAVGARGVGALAEEAERIKGLTDPEGRAASIEALSAALDEARQYIAGLVSAA
jgi:HPt (histidine-containing phosphotransfer) domain-containing protein